MGRPKGLKYHRTIAVRLEEDFGAALAEMARKEDRPIGVMARILLKEAIATRQGAFPSILWAKYPVTGTAEKKKGKAGK